MRASKQFTLLLLLPQICLSISRSYNIAKTDFINQETCRDDRQQEQISIVAMEFELFWFDSLTCDCNKLKSNNIKECDKKHIYIFPYFSKTRKTKKTFEFLMTENKKQFHPSEAVEQTLGLGRHTNVTATEEATKEKQRIDQMLNFEYDFYVVFADSFGRMTQIRSKRGIGSTKRVFLEKSALFIGRLKQKDTGIYYFIERGKIRAKIDLTVYPIGNKMETFRIRREKAGSIPEKFLPKANIKVYSSLASSWDYQQCFPCLGDFKRHMSSVQVNVDTCTFAMIDRQEKISPNELAKRATAKLKQFNHVACRSSGMEELENFLAITARPSELIVRSCSAVCEKTERINKRYKGKYLKTLIANVIKPNVVRMEAVDRKPLVMSCPIRHNGARPILWYHLKMNHKEIKSFIDGIFEEANLTKYRSPPAALEEMYGSRRLDYMRMADGELGRFYIDSGMNLRINELIEEEDISEEGRTEDGNHYTMIWTCVQGDPYAGDFRRNDWAAVLVVVVAIPSQTIDLIAGIFEIIGMIAPIFVAIYIIWMVLEMCYDDA
ncbi:hypothetical protein Ciccas_010388, partial [Cichlidogyrus casuarinus]